MSVANFEDYMEQQKKRTNQQNRAMHKYFRDLAQALNDAGFTVAKTVTKPLEIPWSEHTVKEVLWRQVQDALVDKESTTELDRNEITQVYDALNRHIAQLTGVSVPFPTKELEQ